MRSRIVPPALLALLSLAPAAFGQEAEAPVARPHASSPVWMADVGYRASFVSDPGLNAFSTRDYLAQFSLGASRKVLERGRFSLAPGLLWDYGSTSATVRGEASSLDAHRLSLSLEARYGLAPWLFAFLRTAPGVASLSARVEDGSAPAPLVKSAWVPAMDLSAGAAWRFARVRNSSVAFWVTGEGGYGWSKSMGLTLAPDLAQDDPRRVASTDLGRLELRGGFLRLGAALSF